MHCIVRVAITQWVAGHRVDKRGQIIDQNTDFFLFSTASRPALGPSSMLSNEYQRIFTRG
jgi:hypothetical protein